ncbi:MAG TPA: hypothetical protein VHM67_05770 [Gemmatimonadaceae bacterium]|nr:hypothetical protein [Gemmatimonadaceae bacterium]
MHAVHSVRAVFTALTAVPGIERCDVVLGSATIEHDGRVTEGALREALAVVDCTVEAMANARTRELPQL